MFVSLLSIFSTAIYRYMLTVHPFKHRVLLNGRRIAIWIVSIWRLSFLNDVVSCISLGGINIRMLGFVIQVIIYILRPDQERLGKMQHKVLWKELNLRPCDSGAAL